MCLARLAALVLVTCGTMPVALAQQAGVSEPAYTEEGTARCQLCHSDLRMTLISETPHGDVDNPDSPAARHGCESCHGPGSFHVTQSRRGQGRPPMVMFGDDVHTPREQQIAVCMGCHVSSVEELLKIEGHANAREQQDILELSCSSCHTIHEVRARFADRAAAESESLAERLSQPPEFTERGTQQCLLCHAEQPMQLMARTVHGNTRDPATPYGQHGCESCHGEGSLHVSLSLGGGRRPAMITFGEDADTPAREQMQTCMSCHRNDWDAMLSIDAHRNAADFENVSCATCHTMHPTAETLQPGSGAPGPTATYTDGGAEQCQLCHAEEHVTQIRNTLHGDRSNPHSPFAGHECEACHGPGSIHVSQSRRGEGRPPMIDFGRSSHTPYALQVETCLSCHNNHDDGFADLEWQGMVHGKDGVCTDCHEVHPEGQLLDSPETEVAVCLGCHNAVRSDGPSVMWDGSMHAFDDVSCRSCHTLHVAGNVLGDSQALTGNCAACHTDPDISTTAFAWQDSVHADNDMNCMDCHTVHTGYNTLRERQAQADSCYACHEDRKTEHPRFEDKAIRFDELNCTSCHDVHQLVPGPHGSGPQTAMEQP